MPSFFNRKDKNSDKRTKSTVVISDDYIRDLEGGSSIVKEFTLYSTMSNEFENRVKQIRDMISISQPISSSVRLYVDDSLQTFPNGRLTEVKSDSSEVKECVEYILDSLKLEDHYGTIASQLVLYGNSFACHPDIKVVKKLTENVKIDKSFREKTQKDLDGLYIADLLDVQDLRIKGKSFGFLVSDRVEKFNKTKTFSFFTKKISIENQDYTLYPTTQYTHFYMDNYLGLEKDIRVARIDGKDEQVEVFTGSGLFDGLYNTANEVKLMKDAVLLQRVTRQASSLFVGVEVGDLPKEKVETLIARYKQMIGQKNIMTSEKFSSTAAPSGIDSIIISPIRNGKGDISTKRIGGDVDVRTLIDLEYFEDELYSGLPPRQFLGKADEGGGLNSGQSLAVQDIRYARTVSRVQNAIERGVREIIDKVLISYGKEDYIGEYTLNLSKVNSAEDNEKLELTQRKLEVAKDILEVYEQMGYDIQSNEVRQQISDVTGLSMIDVESEAGNNTDSSNEKDDNDEEFNDDRETMSLDDLDIPPDNPNTNEEETE